MLTRSLVAALAAEAIGTFLFFVVGGGAAIADAQTGGAVGLLGIALALFVWAARSGQFDDLETPAMRALHDDVGERKEPPKD